MVLLGLFLIHGLLETIGVASIMPFMAVVGDPEIISRNAPLSRLYEVSGATSTNSFLVMLGVAAFLALVVALVFGAFTQWFLHRYSQLYNLRLSVRLLNTYYSRPYVWFLNHHSADLGRTVLHEVGGLVAHSILPALRIVSKLVVVVFLLGLVVIADPVVAVSAAVALAVMYGIVYLSVRRYLGRLSAATWEANEQRFRIAQEGLGAIKQVKVAGLEARYMARFLDPAQRLARYYANHAILSMLPKYLMEALAFGGILLLLVFLLLTRDQGLGYVLPLIAVYAFAGYRLMPALQSVYHDLADMRFGSQILDKLYPELISGKQQGAHFLRPETNSSPALELRNELRLENVTLTYPGASAKVLDNVMLSIPANTTVAFVGSTGAGKTTIVDVILGLLAPDSGGLVVDGVPITGENLRQWQRALGYVPQDIFLKDDTVAANIAFGEPPESIDMGAVERAAKSAELHDFVVEELAGGYDALVGERGVRLSGGQRQRIGIARALYRNPSVLVLDEATSALDNLTERAVMSAVDQLGNEKTIIIIAHRLSTVRNCDLIFLMERGRVVASGTYDELARSNERFRAMAQGSV